MIVIMEAGLYSEFANSFLVLCNNSNGYNILPQAEYIHYSQDRKKDTNLYTKKNTSNDTITNFGIIDKLFYN